MKQKIIFISSLMLLIIATGIWGTAGNKPLEIALRCYTAAALGILIGIGVMVSFLKQLNKAPEISESLEYDKEDIERTRHAGTIAEMILKYQHLLSLSDVELAQHHSIYFGKRKLCPGCRNYFLISNHVHSCHGCPAISEGKECYHQNWYNPIIYSTKADEIRKVYSKRLKHYEGLYEEYIKSVE